MDQISLFTVLGSRTNLTFDSGFGTVARLAQHNAHVYMGVRNHEKGTSSIQRIQAKYPNARITLLDMDHLSLESVASAAESFLSKETALHGLINNAGIMASPFEITGDGFEAQWQTNYLAHWVFTSRLLPILLQTAKTLEPGSVRVVNLSSSGHTMAPGAGICFEDLNLKGKSSMVRYGQSKLANILHAKTMNKLYGPNSPHAASDGGEIWTAIVHPGLVKSGIADNAEMPWLLRKFFDVYGAMGGMVDPDVGSWTSLFCVASPEMTKEQSGMYFQRIAQAGWQSKIAGNTELAKRLEEWTEMEMKQQGFH